MADGRHLPEVQRARQQGIADLLRRTARRVPNQTAVVAGERRATYAEFDEAVDRLSHSLDSRGLAKGDRLALLSHNCWEYVVVVFAAARLGLVLVPINFMLRAEEVAFILDHAGVVGFIVEAGLADTGEQALALIPQPVPLRGWIGLDGQPPRQGWEDIERWIADGDRSEVEVAIADDDPVRLMYTSGTESRPKGAVLTSRSLISQYVGCIIDGGMTADDIEVHSLPMYHCAQLDCFFAVDVYLGATSIILPGPDPVALLRAIERERVTKLFAPPTVWISLLRCPEFDASDLSSLRKGYYGASPMPVEVLKELQQRLPDVALWNFYGQTEMAPLATILRPNEQVTHAGSAGRPSINVETRVVDDDGRSVTPGEIGEIVHRSPQATLGYWNAPEQTAAAFQGGWFHSGDLGVMSTDGYLSVVDRKKDMIKSGGENVASREVEEVIYALDGVAEVAVFGVAHPRWVEAVTAVVVARPGVTLDEDAVHQHCRSQLAGFKCPKYVVITDVLPKNPSGKVLKRELRISYADIAAAG